MRNLQKNLNIIWQPPITRQPSPHFRLPLFLAKIFRPSPAPSLPSIWKKSNPHLMKGEGVWGVRTKHCDSRSSKLNEEKLSKLNVRNFNKQMGRKKIKMKTLKEENKGKQFHLVRLIRNQEELEKIVSECYVENIGSKRKDLIGASVDNLKELMLPCPQK